MKKLLACILAAAHLAAVSPAPRDSAASAVLMHADTRQVLYEKNADARMLIASTTKIMTALVVLESCALTERVGIDARSAGTEGSSMYLREGEEYSAEELLYGLMLISGNDAAVALALHVSDSIEDFAELMNEKAAELGMENTHYVNPHGLDAEGHYSTARDMALLAAYAMENPDFARIASTKSVEIRGNTLQNHNRLLFTYPGCIGLKTGYTMAAGRTLVSCAERDGERYIVVTLCDKNDWKDHESLYDWAFESFEWRRVIDSGTVFRLPYVGEEDWLYLSPEADIYSLLPTGAGEVEYRLELPPFAISPVESGERLGKIIAQIDGITVGITGLSSS